MQKTVPGRLAAQTSQKLGWQANVIWRIAFST